MAVKLALLLIPDARCCDDLVGQDGYVGVTLVHPHPEDGTSHERSMYWRDAPPGRPVIELDSFDPLTIAGPVDCSCGWSGTVTAGKITAA